MTLIEFESGRKILIDVNIRTAADDQDDGTPDVAKMLRERLSKDAQGRQYVDAFLLSHPDQDHCAGLKNHFHLGLPADR
jgi:Cft2 family RNA processing exonuclease